MSSLQNKIPTMVPTGIYAPRGSPSCLLPLWEALQVQQVGLIQASFKWLSLQRVGSWSMKFCLSFKCRVPVSYGPLSSPIHKPHWPSKPYVLGAHLPGTRSLGWGARCGAWTTWSLYRPLTTVIILLFVGNLPNRKWHPLKYSCLENSIGRRAWRATVHGVAKSQTWLHACYQGIWVLTICVSILFTDLTVVPALYFFLVGTHFLLVFKFYQ